MHEAMVLWSMTMLMSGRLAGRRRHAFIPRQQVFAGLTAPNTFGRSSAARPRAVSRFTRERTPSIPIEVVCHPNGAAIRFARSPPAASDPDSTAGICWYSGASTSTPTPST
ncbi:hypothetical protein [Streptomyces sp. NPDC048606]|uniref:hypothetical protein n=1 Tax=Streptomyces sp. NPDC048606 TaxID=3154726 RepID=UPI0034329632